VPLQNSPIVSSQAAVSLLNALAGALSGCTRLSVNRDGAMNADYWRARMERLQFDANLLPQQRDCIKALMRELESMSAQLHESFDVASPPPATEPLMLQHSGSA
jgi:hypothetical protein